MSEPYSALDATTQQIRLLRFMPEQFDAEQNKIRITLETYELDFCPSYAALSYHWGDVDPQHSIQVNGVSVHVRQHLHEALTAIKYQVAKRARSRAPEVARSMPGDDGLRIKNEKLYLYSFPWTHFWTDAICIDQLNVTERSHQVGMMGRIFKNADCVLVWPGTGCDSAYRIFRAYLSKKSPILLRKEDTSLDFFCSSLYWKRAWIRQEFYLAHSILFISEKMTLVCEDDLYGHVERIARLDWADAPTIMRRRSRQGVLMRSGIDISALPSILNESWHCRCSDPRDKIYSVLGLLRWDEALNVKILQADYTIDTSELADRVLQLCRAAQIPSKDYGRLRLMLKYIYKF